MLIKCIHIQILVKKNCFSLLVHTLLPLSCSIIIFDRYGLMVFSWKMKLKSLYFQMLTNAGTYILIFSYNFLYIKKNIKMLSINDLKSFPQKPKSVSPDSIDRMICIHLVFIKLYVTSFAAPNILSCHWKLL